MTQTAPLPELFDLPDALRELLERAGYQGRLAIVSRTDGRPLGEYDRRVVTALLRATANEAENGGPARDALVRSTDGAVAWTPEARVETKREPASGSKPGKTRSKRAAAKRPQR